MPDSPAPIALFAYNRKDNLERMFRALLACEGFSKSPVTLFIDGPKGDQDRAQVEEVRTFARAIDLPNMELVIREENMGLKDAIYTGVTEVCDRYGRVIVLEDDLILSPVALEYFNSALDTYEKTPRVWSIVGYQYSVPKLEQVERALMLPYTYPWGWATWSRAWDQYDMYAPVDDRDLLSTSFRHAFDVQGIRDFTNMIKLALEDKVSCWFTPWYYKMFSEGGVSIFPPRTYIQNIGIRKGGTHSSSLNPYYYLVRPAEVSDKLCEFPNDIKVDYWAIDAINSSWDARVQKMISHLGRIKRMLLAR